MERSQNLGTPTALESFGTQHGNFEHEFRGGRRAAATARPGFGGGQPRRQSGQSFAQSGMRRPPRPSTGLYSRRSSWPVDPSAAYTVADEPAPSPATVGQNRVRWIQRCLNRAMGTRLKITGVMNRSTRSVVRSFQRQKGLRATGRVGSVTEGLLRTACPRGGAQPVPMQQAPAEPPPEQTPDEPAASTADQDSSGAGDAAPAPASDAAGGEGQGDEEFGGIFDTIKSTFGSGGPLSSSGVAQGIKKLYEGATDTVAVASGSRIIDMTGKADKSIRKGTRDIKVVNALVLHQMACCFAPKDPLKRFLTLNAHFAILSDGRILQLHPMTSLLWASNGFNGRSVAVEFAGNFPNTKGVWWQGTKFGRNRPTAAQFEAGRYLLRYLKQKIGLTHVFAHRQSSDTRTNDPGPDIWYRVGQWAVDNLKISDGGPGFKIHSGAPIAAEWRTWGSSSVKHEATWSSEIQKHGAQSDQELWQGQPEGPWNYEVSFPAAVANPKANGPGVYTLYKGGRRVYVGRSRNLRRRLMQHLWCLQHLSADASDYAVKLTPMANATPEQLQRVEAAVISKWGRSKTGGALTNVKSREMEALFGESWN